MRQLTEEETRTLFTKLANYCGSELKTLIAGPSGEGQSDQMVFRLQRDRVFYCSLTQANLASAIPRANLLSIGTLMGKFTKTGKFRLHITALAVIAPHARSKLYIKQNGEMPFLYGGNVVKAHVGRISEETPANSGVIVFSMDDTPLGFGVTLRSTAELKKLEPTAIFLARQGDCGEYLREEDSMFTT
ncbi:hypothetical protein N7462_005052 [Penicillium macrosclerotiorum]|uniref:uncharacterized protein n=1 Tax=Penicillium macrosclerotiorum TaxID=303699 RepID=UPI0025473E60|nr:uncharacterized protein N7462_005052 [Penicillium macrosclerotiorum]KAJ5690660.1 hypothetical protein N7462_005052 [Penicillium macrosclerotiorum]